MLRSIQIPLLRMVVLGLPMHEELVEYGIEAPEERSLARIFIEDPLAGVRHRLEDLEQCGRAALTSLAIALLD
jgi:hypothetical protein